MIRFALLLLTVAGCATPARTVPADLDAANPDAEETPARPPLTPLTSPGPEQPGAKPEAPPHAHPHAYVCPMHPEVTSDAPGKCPKCGMDLVPVAEGAK